MATQNELFYKPEIEAPLKERAQTPDSIINDRIESQISGDFIPSAADKADPYMAYFYKFENYKNIAAEIKKRAEFLIDLTIDDLDGYVGDAPFSVVSLLEELTDISFHDANGKPLPETDPVYTLNPEIIKCLYRVAGVKDPYREEKDLLDVVNNMDTNEIRKKVEFKVKGLNLKSLVYGLKLLTVVLKIAYVITVHYTIGWMCGWFKGKLKIGFKFKVARKRIGKTWALGNMIAKELKKLEAKLLKVVGYSCRNGKKETDNCNTDQWRKVSFKQINCCSMDRIFFGPAIGNVNEPSSFMLSSCFEKYIRTELDPTYAGARTICSITNAENTGIEPSDYEKAAAKEIVRFLETRKTISGTMGSGTENIATLSKAIELAEAGSVMTTTAQSSILASRDYANTGNSTSKMDCFGLTDENSMTAEERMATAINSVSGTWLPKNNGETIHGNSYFDILESIDSSVYELLKAADKSVSCVANLAKWGSSKQLCCYIYLLTAIASIWKSLINKGVWCPDQETGDAIRNEFHLQWAKELKAGEDIKALISLLQVIKQIVDIFINKMQRQILVVGFTLPLKEMWELIKVTIANGLSEYLDILFGPLDKIIGGLQLVPELRHMINNECFGFDKFLKFMMCLLGNLKWGIVNQIMKIFDFSLNDIVLMNDILLSRMRLKSLEALSSLLGAVINLVLGLKDCYTPDDLINNLVDDKENNLISMIVAQETVNEYNSAVKLANLTGTAENLARLEEISRPLLADSNTFSQEEQESLDSMQASISSQFGDFGPIARDIVNGAINAEAMDISRFIDQETGKIVSYGEFVRMIEDMTGITMDSVRESLMFIFDILRGNNETA